MVDAKEAVAAIRKKLGHLTFEWKPTAYLDTGFEDLNEALGHRKKGLAYGRIIELSGLESQGKSAIGMSLAAKAQKDGALVLVADIENSYDPEWALKRGLDSKAPNFALFQPYLGVFGVPKRYFERSLTAKEKRRLARRAKIASAEAICDELESSIKSLSRYYPKIFLLVDSIASFLPALESKSSIKDRNMRDRMELSMFLGGLLRRWVGFAQQHNVLMFLINQLRQGPNAGHGDPYYTPGGNTVRFFCHVRARCQRVKGGKIMRKGRQSGIQGILRNKKNKAGGVENTKVGYKILFDGPMVTLPASSLEREDG